MKYLLSWGNSHAFPSLTLAVFEVIRNIFIIALFL